jgi:hypothetical protein
MSPAARESFPASATAHGDGIDPVAKGADPQGRQEPGCHRLYLPKRWTDDPVRCRGAGIPAAVRFATKLDLAHELLAEALAA